MISVTTEFKVVVVIPAGRKRYMEIAWPLILREYDLVDEIRFCINTNVPEDIEWIRAQEEKYDKVTLDLMMGGQPFQHGGLFNFWRNLKDRETIYIRFDDDIVYISEGFIKKMLDFRLANPQYLFVLPNVINNSITDHIHQRMGVLVTDPIGYECMNENGARRGDVAEVKHRTFLKNLKNNEIDKYKFNRWILNGYERMSINSLCWFGKDLDGVDVGPDEEQQIASDIPDKLGRPNVVYGDVIVSHFAFGPQRDHMDGTDILAQYKEALKVK